MCRWEGGGTRSLKGAHREGEIPRDLAPGGGEITGGGEIPGTPESIFKEVNPIAG